MKKSLVGTLIFLAVSTNVLAQDNSWKSYEGVVNESGLGKLVRETKKHIFFDCGSISKKSKAEKDPLDGLADIVIYKNGIPIIFTKFNNNLKCSGTLFDMYINSPSNPSPSLYSSTQ